MTKINKYPILIAVIGTLMAIVEYFRVRTNFYIPIELFYTILAVFVANVLFKDITEFLKEKGEVSIDAGGDVHIQHNYSVEKEEIEKIVERELSKFRVSPSGGAIDNSNIEDIISQLEETVFSTATDSIINRITEKIEKNKNNDEVKERVERTIRRLLVEIQNLTNRSSLNLTIGVIISVLGFAALAYFVFTYEASIKTPSEMMAYFIPRASLILFVEIFAYFFLRLYKDTLNEIKYFQNELTNVETKYISLSTAIKTDNSELISVVVTYLAKTERNFILNKGQSTVDLENNKNHNSDVVDSIKSVSSIFNGKTK